MTIKEDFDEDPGLYDSWYTFCRLGLRCIGRYDVQVKGPTPPENAVIAATHASYLDPLCIIFGLKRDFFFPSLWPHFPWVGSIDVRRGLTLQHYGQMEELFERGYSLGIFPEGKRSQDEGKVDANYKGAISLARHFERPLVPVAIKGTGPLWPKGQKYPRSLWGKVVLHCGEPFIPQGRGTSWGPSLRSKLQHLYDTA